MELNLNRKVVAVTGGKKGIGKGIVLSLAKEGAIPVVIDRNPIDEDFESALHAVCEDFSYFTIDLRDTDKIQSVVDEVIGKYGSLYGVVNNAGANDNLGLEDTSWEQFEESLHANLTHYYELVRAALPHLKKSSGSILNIGSKTALTGQGHTSAYAAAKGAILGLTREWAAALAKDNVRSNAIIVAEAWTPLYEKWITSFGDEDAQKARLNEITHNIPLGARMTSVEEIADTAVFVLSPRSSHTTGQWIHVDGGYVHLDRALQQ
ncbi:SDR family oxidoreductase [Corynebacterium sp. FDAARGOS 1242]|uniref:SDR family oxidoreductase n=1 Tax=Corynebacterium sp. FDAARGOS 1242 TaxID=2778078 RepID=UPI00194E57A3|nr:SDR family oxidoreductase [Corynebacterium sp. FDAARGOS 1242]QRP97495.1 SDR family oxidoreductase [Corynebacterium sp. FDAARGOS 1242]